MSFTFTPDKGWKKFEMAINPARVNAAMITAIYKATAVNAAIVAKEMRKFIKKNEYSANATLTQNLKGSSKALFDTGLLYQSIQPKMLDKFSAFIGILRQTKTADGKGLANIAEKLHDGFEIRVTPKMRGLFAAIANAQKGKLSPDKLTGRAAFLYRKLKRPVKALKPGTEKMIVPARPFVERVFFDSAIMARVKMNWARAAQAALKV